MKKILCLLITFFISKYCVAQNLSCDLIYFDFNRKVDFLTKKENKSVKIFNNKEELDWNSSYAKTLINRFKYLYPDYYIDSLIDDSIQKGTFCEFKNKKNKKINSYIEYSYSKPLIEIEGEFYFILRDIYFKPKNWNEGYRLGVELIMYKKKGNEFLKYYSVFAE
jgi:hypothetical protein